MFHTITDAYVATVPKRSRKPALINRRHALGLLAAAGCCRRAALPMSRLNAAKFARTWPSTSPTRAQAGTFVGYKVDDYLVIASDRNRSVRRSCRPRRSRMVRIQWIALETGVVGDPDNDVSNGTALSEAISSWNRDHTLRFGDRGIRRAGLSGDRAAHRRGTDAEIISTCLNMATATSAAASTSSG